MRSLKIVISGLTAAGKSTHGKLLATTFAIPYVSSTTILADLVADRTGRPPESRWQPSLDAERAQDVSIDDELDATLSRLFHEMEDGVFDACLLPWVAPSDDVVNLWIESDMPSRVRKCIVSHIGEGIDEPEATERVRVKDDFTIRRLRMALQREYVADERFDIVADNSILIPETTLASAEAGIAAFHPVLVEAVRFAAGDLVEAPRSTHLIRTHRS